MNTSIFKLLVIPAILNVALNVRAQQDTSNLQKRIKKDTVVRSLPSPLPNPPFPTSDWDGAPLVGVDATAPNYPIQKALGFPNSRYETAYANGVMPYDNGTRKDQFTAAMDLIVRF